MGSEMCIRDRSEKDDQKTIEIKILTNRHDPMDMKAKKKLLYRINKYT